MKLTVGCVADTHLGYRTGSKTTPDGRNLREHDVEMTFRAVMYDMYNSNVDLVLMGGDMFHHPRVGASAIYTFLSELQMMVAFEKPVIIAAGNHDIAKSPDIEAPLVLTRVLRWHNGKSYVYFPERRAAAATPLWEAIRGLQVQVTVLPAGKEVVPDNCAPSEKFNLLLAHAAVPDKFLPEHYASLMPPFMKEVDQYHAVILGDYHEACLLGDAGGRYSLHRPRKMDIDEPMAFYCGSTDYTSSNYWGEHPSKGWVKLEIDLEAGTKTVQLMPVSPLRPKNTVVVSEATPKAVNKAVEELIAFAADQDEDPLVRIVAEDFDITRKSEINWSRVQHLKDACALLNLDIRPRDLPPTMVPTDKGHSVHELLDGYMDDLGETDQEVREAAHRYLKGEA